MQSLEHAPNIELLGRLTGPGPAAQLLRRFGGLTGIARASDDELRQLAGIGPGRAAALRAAFLLAGRLTREAYGEAPLLDTPERVAGYLREDHRAENIECFRVVFLNARHRSLGVQTLATGILDQVLVHAREVFAPAIAKRAAAVILTHNHPSGDPTPSEADVRLTRDLVRAGQLLRIHVLDHVIFGSPSADRPRDYCSLLELGYLAG